MNRCCSSGCQIGQRKLDKVICCGGCKGVEYSISGELQIVLAVEGGKYSSLIDEISVQEETFRCLIFDLGIIKLEAVSSVGMMSCFNAEIRFTALDWHLFWHLLRICCVASVAHLSSFSSVDQRDTWG